MPIVFNGATKVITLSSGVTSVPVSTLYSRWKDWVKTADNAKYLPAFSEIGGEPLGGGLSSAVNTFIRNDLGWRIRPPEENIDINLIGNIYPSDPAAAWRVPPVGSFMTSISTNASVGLIVLDGAPEDVALAVLDGANSVESGLTVRQAMRLISAALAGKVSGAEGTSITIRNAVADSKNRIVATVDADGNRTGVVVDTS